MSVKVDDLYGMDMDGWVGRSAAEVSGARRSITTGKVRMGNLKTLLSGQVAFLPFRRIS